MLCQMASKFMLFSKFIHSNSNLERQKSAVGSIYRPFIHMQNENLGTFYAQQHFIIHVIQ